MLLIGLAILLSAALLAILIALTLLVERYDELVIAIKLNLDLLVGLDNVDLMCCGTALHKLRPLVVEQIAED